MRRSAHIANSSEKPGIMRHLILFPICILFVFGACQRHAPSYVFTRGTALKKQFLPGEKIVNPTLVTSARERSFSFPVGAEIFHESANGQYVYILYPDRRFAAFLTYGVDVVDVPAGKRHHVAGNMVYWLEMVNENGIVAVQRMPETAGDDRYDDAGFVLSVSTVSFSPFRVSREILCKGDHLPDGNRIMMPDDEEKMQQSLYLEGNRLHYQNAGGDFLTHPITATDHVDTGH
jgi:hypothetical protein